MVHTLDSRDGENANGHEHALDWAVEVSEEEGAGAIEREVRSALDEYDSVNLTGTPPRCSVMEKARVSKRGEGSRRPTRRRKCVGDHKHDRLQGTHHEH